MVFALHGAAMNDGFLVQWRVPPKLMTTDILLASQTYPELIEPPPEIHSQVFQWENDWMVLAQNKRAQGYQVRVTRQLDNAILMDGF